MNCLKAQGFHVHIISAAMSLKGCYKPKTIEIDTKETHIYLGSIGFKNPFLKRLSILLFWIKLSLKLLTVKKSPLLVYHSLFYRIPLSFLRTFGKLRFCLQIEDVYSSLKIEYKKFKKKEWDFFLKAESYICVNDMIAEKLEHSKKQLISYGSYSLPTLNKYPKSDRVHLVYAGIIEQARNAAFIALEAMLHLDNQYQLHILGFGNPEDIECLVKQIDSFNHILGRQAIIFEGRKEGDEYYALLQKCDIALSTHCYDNLTMESANHTFPSKILVYMANNLRVVAQKIPCLEHSAINEFIHFYDKPDPILIANAIKKVDLSKPCDSRNVIASLNEAFLCEIGELFK